MAGRQNRRYTLASRPRGPARLSDFELTESPIPTPEDGQVLVRNTLFSIDPYQRNLMGNGSSEWPTIEIGAPMGGPTLGEIVESRNPAFTVGDHVQTWNLTASTNRM